LRDVLGWSAREAAEVLDVSVAAANSALQRARESIDRECRKGTLARVHQPENERAEAELMRRFVDAWEAVDIERLTSLLATDSLMTMPPEAMHFVGPAEIGGFFATVPMDGRLDLIRLLGVRANGQPALAAYVQESPAEPLRAYGIMVFAVDADHIAGITGFAGYPELFPVSELPTELR
jgi:RNA polymerase sigma-70 factor, ECF subfamily